jgi:periplasmic protein CpxP/Spy
MTIRSTCTSAVLAASILLPAYALAPAALAQNQTPESPAQGEAATPKQPAPKAKPRQGKSESRSERVEQHIKQLHTQLKITPEQQSQWDQFAEVMRDNAKDMDQLIDQRGTGFEQMNAVDNLQSYAKLAMQHAVDTQRLATAFQSLYETMSEEQKKNADSVFRSRGDRPTRRKKG